MITTTDTRVRRLERRVSRLESAGRVPPEAVEAYARLAATAPVSEADQARHRAELLAALRGTWPDPKGPTMTDRPTVTETRRSLVQSSDACFEQAKAHSNARKTDGAAHDAWCGYMTAANLTNVIAAMLGRVAADHGEEYTACLVEIVAGAEADGEDAYFANDDVRFSSPVTEESK